MEELPLPVRLLREIHAELLKGLRGSNLPPGETRRSQNWIGPAGCTLSDATSIPPPFEEASASLGRLAAGNGHRLLERLFGRPILSVAGVKPLLDVTYPAANGVVSKFEELGTLKEITGQRRNRLFRYDPYTDLFSKKRRTRAIHPVRRKPMRGVGGQGGAAPAKHEPKGAVMIFFL